MRILQSSKDAVSCEKVRDDKTCHVDAHWQDRRKRNPTVAPRLFIAGNLFQKLAGLPAGWHAVTAG